MLNAFFIRVLNPAKGEDFRESEALAKVILDVCAELQIDVRQGDHASGIGEMMPEIRKAIEQADLVFADASSSNQNVWYEIGYADHVNLEKTICLFRTDRGLPFDRQGIRALEYAALPGEAERLASELRTRIAAVLKKVVFPSFLPPNDNVAENEAADNFVENVPDGLHHLGRQWLVSVALNNSAEETARRAAVRALFRLGTVTPEHCIELTRQSVSPTVRASVYEQLSLSDQDVPAVVWEPKDLRNQVLIDAYSRALSHHFRMRNLNESLVFDWVRLGSEDALSAFINQALRGSRPP